MPDPGDPRALYVIDISGYVFRAYHALPPLQSPKGEPTHAVLGVTTMLLKLVADQRPAMLGGGDGLARQVVSPRVYAELQGDAARPAA